MLTSGTVAMVALIDTTSNEGPPAKPYGNTVSRKLRNYDTDNTDYDNDLLLLQALEGRAIFANSLEDADVRGSGDGGIDARYEQ